MPLFSVIVPVYNVEPYIRDCLDSILLQTYEDYEVVLIDDGSTDKSGDICEEYAKSYDKVRVIHKENGGLVSARQSGVCESHGEYCVALDSDDWIKPSYLSEFAQVISRYNPDIVCSGIELIDDNNVISMIPSMDEGYYNRSQIIQKIFPKLIQSSNAESFEPNICSKAIRRSLYEPCQLSVNMKIKNGEDSSCTIPCFYYSKSVYILKSSNYCYRYNRASMTKNLKPMPWEQQVLLTNHIKNNIDINEYDFREQLNRRICHGLFNICISQFYCDRGLFKIKKEINYHLDDELYKEAIRDAKFSSTKAILMHLTLKYKLTFIMYLYSRLRENN